jgi:acetate---CoA ligase (ADP-forming)
LTKPQDLGRLLAPASIAVVGANERPGSYGSQVLLNLRAIGYGGEVWGINPGRESALGYPCVPSVSELPMAADAVVVAIPAAGVPDVIEAAGARGCGGAVVISAGFGEVESGRSLQASLVAAAEGHALPVCGPNCNGIVGMWGRYALWGDALTPNEDPGGVVLISQSGNVAVNALATRRGLRFHTVIASGNQAVLSAADFLAFVAGADDVASVALYLEDDGDPSLCDALAACADAGVRVAVLKVGTSAAGARAAAAHSAALTGDQRVFRSLVGEAGAAWAADVHELLELAKTFAVRPRPRGRGLAIMTCSGGDSAQGADEATRLGIELPALAPETSERLRSLLPAAATVGNPIDYTAMIWGEVETLAELVAVVGADPAIDQVLVFYDQPPGIEGAPEESWRAVRDGITTGAARSPVPTIVASTLPELLDDAAAWRFIGSGIPAVAGLRTGLVCAAARMTPPGDPERLRAIARAARLAAGAGAGAGVGVGVGAEGVWLSEHDSKALLRAAGVPVVVGRLVTDEHDAVSALVELGGATVLKLSAESVQHKSELGAVILDLRTEPGMREAYATIAALAVTHRGEVLAERMEEPAVELLVAARRDGVVPFLTIGLGGIWTELLDDVAVVPLPATPERVERALRSLRGARVLSGGRGREALDVKAAGAVAARIGEVLLERELALIECNPVLVKADGALVLDALAIRGGPPSVQVSGSEVPREERAA